MPRCIEQFIAGAKAAAASGGCSVRNRNCRSGGPGTAKTVKFDREAARALFEKMRSRDPELASKMLLAARKGEGLSESDMEGLIEDLAKLERLDDEDGGE